ncbi:MAG: hypothetical protein IIA03_16595 [Proteobacteria bacterium]|nr:hypothetical protein [Pseudomonadota bacterium]
MSWSQEEDRGLEDRVAGGHDRAVDHDLRTADARQVRSGCDQLQAAVQTPEGVSAGVRTLLQAASSSTAKPAAGASQRRPNRRGDGSEDRNGAQVI